MARWLLPVVLVVGQLLYWPGMLLLRGDPVPPLPAAGVAAACLLIGAGLGRRRERPAPAFAVVLAGTVLATLAAPTGRQWFETGDALVVIGAALPVALFSVAVRAPARTTLCAFGAAVLWEGVLAAVQVGLGPDYPLTVVLAAVVHGVVAALGRRRGRWNAERAAAARRLVAAHQAERDATGTERRRLARELHDVTAHHLTSIVVNSSAAQMLGEQRPDLRAEALDFAARTGREALADLRRLVAIMPAAAPSADEPDLTDLAEGFRALGQRITLDLPDGGPPPEVAAVAYGIAREALTNTLRYAPGADVLVTWSDTRAGAQLVIEDDGGTTPVTGLGGGRGLAGMRERAAAAGGTCEAGPRPGGGWRVRLVLPEAGGTVRASYRWLRSQVLIDAALIAMLLLAQAGGVLLAVEEGLTPAATALVVLALVAQTVPLMWHRRAPWRVLAATVLIGGLGVLLVPAGVVPAGLGHVFVPSCLPGFAAAYAVAVRGVRPGLTWLAAPAVAVPWALALSLLLSLDVAGDPAAGGQAPLTTAVVTVLLTVIMAIALLVPATICWGLGFTRRRRRDRLWRQEEGGVAVALEQAAFQARLERLRVAAGLHEAVLRYAADVPGAAERGDLGGVLGASRQALGAMRSLLDGLGGGPAEPSAPSPAPAAVPFGSPASAAGRAAAATPEEVPSSPSA